MPGSLGGMTLRLVGWKGDPFFFPADSGVDEPAEEATTEASVVRGAEGATTGASAAGETEVTGVRGAGTGVAGAEGTGVLGSGF